MSERPTKDTEALHAALAGQPATEGAQLPNREQAEGALAGAAAVAAQFRGLLEAAPDAIVILGSDQRILLVNAQTESLFGYGREELIGEPVEKLMPERFRSRHAGHVAGYFAEPQVRPMGTGLEPVTDQQLGAVLEAAVARFATRFQRGTAR